MMAIKTKKWKTQISLSKWKLKFADYKSCLEVTQLKNEINYLEKIRLRWIVSENVLLNIQINMKKDLSSKNTVYSL